MKRLLCSAVLFLSMSSAAGAHHGTNGQFDSTKIIEIGGTITKMAFVNPHSYVYFDAIMSDGSVETWNCELRASSVMRRSGWTKEMFEVGTEIDIVGVASRKDPKGCYTETISFNGSAPIGRYDQINADSLKPVVKDRPVRTAWGAPNLAGDWAAQQRLHGKITAANAIKISPENLETLIEQTQGGTDEERRSRWHNETSNYSAAGKAFAQSQATDSSDRVTGRLDCNPRDFFADWTFDQPTNQINQTEDLITLKYGFMDTVRKIHIGSDFPQDITPSWAGYSIGSWDGDTLVVETKGFTAGGSERRGFHSEAYEVTEFFDFDAETQSITRTYKASDPVFWPKGHTKRGSDTVYVSEVKWEPYNCDDRSVE